MKLKRGAAGQWLRGRGGSTTTSYPTLLGKEKKEKDAEEE